MYTQFNLRKKFSAKFPNHEGIKRGSSIQKSQHDFNAIINLYMQIEKNLYFSKCNSYFLFLSFIVYLSLYYISLKLTSRTSLSNIIIFSSNLI